MARANLTLKGHCRKKKRKTLDTTGSPKKPAPSEPHVREIKESRNYQDR